MIGNRSAVKGEESEKNPLDSSDYFWTWSKPTTVAVNICSVLDHFSYTKIRFLHSAHSGLNFLPHAEIESFQNPNIAEFYAFVIKYQRKNFAKSDKN